MTEQEWKRYCALPWEFRNGRLQRLESGAFVFNAQPFFTERDGNDIAEAFCGWSLLVALRKRRLAPQTFDLVDGTVRCEIHPHYGTIDEDTLGFTADRDFTALLAAAEHVSTSSGGAE